MKKICICIVLCLVVFGASAQRIYKDGDQPGKQSCIPFVLPKTLLKIQVTQQTIAIKPGPFFDRNKIERLIEEGRLSIPFEDKLVQLEAISNINRDSSLVLYKLKEAGINQSAIPDESKAYWIEFGKKWNKERSINIEYGEGQVAKSFVGENADKTVSILIAGLKSLAGVAGAVVGLGFKDIKDDKFVETIDRNPSPFDSVWAAANLIELKINTEFVDRNSNINPEVFKEQLRILEAKRNSLLALITFTVEKEDQVAMFNWEPDPAPGDPVNLFYFSEKEGVRLDSTIIANSYHSFVNKGFKIITSTSAIEKETVALHVRPRGKAGKSSDPGEQDGYAYNVPLFAVFDMKQGSKLLGSATFAIPQYGYVRYLPKKTNSMEVKLDPVTGALLSIKAKANSLDPGTIEKVGSLSESLDKFKGKSELELLTEQRQILEEKKKIQDLQKDGVE